MRDSSLRVCRPQVQRPHGLKQWGHVVSRKEARKLFRHGLCGCFERVPVRWIARPNGEPVDLLKRVSDLLLFGLEEPLQIFVDKDGLWLMDDHDVFFALEHLIRSGLPDGDGTRWTWDTLVPIQDF